MATWKKVLTEEAIATGTSLGTSNVLVPSQNAVKTYVDNNSSNITVDTSITDGGTNPVDGDAIYDALADKQDTIDSSNRLSATLIGSNGNVSNTEFGYLAAVSSDIQAQFDNLGTDKQDTIDSNARLNANLIGANGNVSNTEYGYLNGVTSAIQTQLDGKQASGSYAALAGSTSQNFSTNDLAVTGNLTVTGTIDTVSSTNSTLVDKTITLSSGSSTEAASDGSGIIVNTGQSLEPKLYFYDDTTSANTDGRIGTGWMMGSLTETQSAANDYHVMGFKTGNGAPGSGIKANGEGAFYWDNDADELYVCTSAYTNTGGG